MVNKITSPPTQKELVDKTNEIIDNLGGASGEVNRNIGEIVTSTIPLTDSGLHLLDGALLTCGSYSNFVDYIANLYDSGDYADIFETEANWQGAVTNNGVCGKFVYDSQNSTVRLPKYSSKIYTKTINNTAYVKGNGKSLGLTNGTNEYGLYIANVNGSPLLTVGGGDINKDVGSSHVAGTSVATAKTYGVVTDGEKSGMITDLSNITTSLDGYYYIVIANSTKTAIEVDIDEIATDLNGKADVDLSNINASKSAKSAIVEWGMPDYTSGITYTYTTANTAQSYTMPERGYFYYSLAANQGTGTNISLNGYTVANYKHWATSGGGEITGVLVVEKNDIVSLISGYTSSASSGYPHLVFFPMKG